MYLYVRPSFHLIGTPRGILGRQKDVGTIKGRIPVPFFYLAYRLEWAASKKLVSRGQHHQGYNEVHNRVFKDNFTYRRRLAVPHLLDKIGDYLIHYNAEDRRHEGPNEESRLFLEEE